MDIQNKTAVVLGGYGLVGLAVCHQLLARNPKRLVVASLRKEEALDAVETLKRAHPDGHTQILPAWGDVLLRAEWQRGDTHPRPIVLADPQKRRQLVTDVLDELTAEIVDASMLAQIILGTAPGLDGVPAEIVVDCINIATAVAYQNIYATARHFMALSSDPQPVVDWPEEVERLLSSIYIPQLVRHMQIYQEAMRLAGTQAFVKVGTSGTGGMGLNIPYTHGEEKPSRVLMSKAAVAGAQTMLIFLLARTQGGPSIVKEIKPTTLIGWKEIGVGPITRGGQSFPLVDCPVDQAVSLNKSSNLAPTGDFGQSVGGVLEAVYIDTGENGLFAAGEFTAITCLGQMQFITPEEIAEAVVLEIQGGNTGRDVIAALDSSAMGPSYRAGYLRQAAINRLAQLETAHGEGVAFEILGPPRLSKLLFEAYLLKRLYKTLAAVEAETPETLAAALADEIARTPKLRQQMLSIGIPILLPDGVRLLRGPLIKSSTADMGWVDLTPANLGKWQLRLQEIQRQITAELDGDTSSYHDRLHPASRMWTSDEIRFDIGEIVGWLFIYEEDGRRMKD